MSAQSDKLKLLQRMRGDMVEFSRECLKVRTKDAETVPFVLNKAQMFIHARLETQRRDAGWVRTLILKGRQQGVSTYTAARFYHRAAMRKGINVYILTHEQPATDTLFGIVDRYQRLNPLAPHVGVSNAKELIFDRLDSSYAVATAGQKAGGRSKAISLFHGSEVAYWANAQDHFSASVQGVPLMPDTEVILESTSAGAGGEFYERWLDAEAGRGDFIPIFIPWWWSAEYCRTPPPDFELDNEADEGMLSEVAYAETFGLSAGQMFWRRNKIIELRSLAAFQKEYPATPAEAWTAPPGKEPFIPPMNVLYARKRAGVLPVGPLVLGVDPASNGGDRFSIAARRGRCCSWVKYRNKIDHLEGTLWIKSLIDDLNPARVNVDMGNIGSAIVTSLKSYGPKYASLVRGVNFGGTSEAKFAKPKAPGPHNRRAEMWQRLSEWLAPAEGASIPDDDALQTDLTAPRLKPRLDNDFLLESKAEMKARGVRSPDLADALALTFAFNEFFQGYQAEDNRPAVFGSDTGLQPTQDRGYIPPPATGPLGWMGAIWVALTSLSWLALLTHQVV